MNQNMLAGRPQTQRCGFSGEIMATRLIHTRLFVRGLQNSEQRSVKHCYLFHMLCFFLSGGTLRSLALRQLIAYAALVPQGRTGIPPGGGLGSLLLNTPVGHQLPALPKEGNMPPSQKKAVPAHESGRLQPIGWFNQRHCLVLSSVLLYVGTHAARKQRGHTFIFKRRTLEPLGKNILDWEPKHFMMLNKPANWKISISPCSWEAGERPIYPEIKFFFKYSLNDICVHLQNYCFLNQCVKLFSSENVCCAVRQYLSPPPPTAYLAAWHNGQSQEEGAVAQSMPP